MANTKDSNANKVCASQSTTLIINATDIIHEVGHAPISPTPSLIIHLRSVPKSILNIFIRAPESTNLEMNSLPEVTESNKRKIKEQFQKIHSQIDKLFDDVEGQLDELTPDQQENAVQFVENIAELIEKIMSWLDKAFEIVLEKIKHGYVIDRNQLRALFEEAIKAMKDSSKEKHPELYDKNQQLLEPVDPGNFKII